jgi:hypothetical protein
VTDPVFGKLRFQPFKPDPAHSHWSGESPFGPVGRNIVALVLGEESGPGESQRALFRTIESRWRELLAKLGDALTAYHAEVMDEMLADPWTIYQLHEILVPRRETPDMKWQVGFESSSDPNHVYILEVEGWEPTGAVEPQG